MKTRHRLAAVWFADIVDYSGLAASDQGGALRLVRVFQTCTRECVERYGGRVVKFLGDGALVEFRSLQGAIAAADALRGSFAECLEEAGVGKREIRIGIHTGEVVETDDDVYGDGVNVAARILDEAAPGEILVSDDAWRQVRQQTEIEFESLGHRELQGVGEVGLHRLERVGDIEPESGGTSRDGLAGLWDEIQRRHVFRVAAAYVVVGITIVQVVAAVFPALNLPEWSLTLAVVMTIVGFPIAVVLAWAFEWTPQGVRRAAPGGPAAKPGRIAVAGVAILASLVVGWWVLDRGLEREEVSGLVDVVGEPLQTSRLAIMYFDAAPDLAHIADGLTEGIIDRFTGTDAIEVVSSHGVERYRGAPIDSVALALGAGLLAHGHVEEVGDSLRVSVELIDATDHSLFGSWQMTRPRGDVFVLRDELVGEIAMRLRSRLGERIVPSRRMSEARNIAAWDLFQKAERMYEQMVAADDPEVRASLARQADSLLEGAEALDPGWIEPILARSRVAAADPSPDNLREAMEHAEAALRSHPGEPKALVQRGKLRGSLAERAADSTQAARYVSGAEGDLRQAVAIEPVLASGWIELARILYKDLWELPEALEAARTAHEKDVFLLEDDHFGWLCEISMQLRDFDDAKSWCAEGRRRFPDKQRLILVELTMLASDGVEPDPDQAWRRHHLMTRLPGADFHGPASRMLVAAVLARAGEADSARAVARRVRVEAAADMRSDPGLAAYMDYIESRLWLILGEEAEALRLLRGFLTVAPGYRAEIARDYWFEALTGDPRFEALVDRARRPIFCRLLCEPPS